MSSHLIQRELEILAGFINGGKNLNNAVDTVLITDSKKKPTGIHTEDSQTKRDEKIDSQL